MLPGCYKLIGLFSRYSFTYQVHKCYFTYLNKFRLKKGSYQGHPVT